MKVNHRALKNKFFLALILTGVVKYCKIGRVFRMRKENLKKNLLWFKKNCVSNFPKVYIP